MYDEITKPIFENSKKLMRYSRNHFLKNSKKVDDRPTDLPTYRPTDIHDLRIYATSRRIKTLRLFFG